jgi:hypothetical protein
MRLHGKFSLSLEAHVFYHYGYTSTDIDTILASWKEKIRLDRVRPTSPVQFLGDKEIVFCQNSTCSLFVTGFPVRVMPRADTV